MIERFTEFDHSRNNWRCLSRFTLHLQSQCTDAMCANTWIMATEYSGFERVATAIVMRGGGHEGRGEDICYTPSDHDLFPEPGSLGLAGSHTFATRLEQLDGGTLFTGEPGMPASRDYRRWAFESALLDLALRQAGTTLGEVLGGSPHRCASSSRRATDIRDWLAVAPALEFKVDPIPGEWDEAHMDALAATGRVRVATSRHTTWARLSTRRRTRRSIGSSQTASPRP